MSGSVVVLENFFDFEVHFIEFIRRTALFSHVKSAHFLIYDAEFTQISYKYDYKGIEEFDFDRVKEKIKDSKVVRTTGQVEYLHCPEAIEVESTGSGNLMINVFNPVLEHTTLIATVIISMDYFPDTAEIARDFNSHYFEQLCYRVQMIIANYEKLYYIIDSYTELLMAKDKYMPYHMSNVANWCIKLANEMNLNEKDSMILYVSALLHDVGKLFVTDAIINKPNKLTDIEFDLLRKHSEKGAQIVRASLYGMTLLDEVPKIIKHHHEHYDGNGYPSSLKGEEIPLLSRILTVADSVDSLLSRRAYKDACTYSEVIIELEKLSNTQFDAKIVNAMIDLLDHHVDENKSIALPENSFIAQASLTFYYKNIHEMSAFTGNLVINKDKGHFICHNHLEDLNVLNIHDIYRTTISFFDMRDFVEYKAEIEFIKEDKFFLKDFMFLPTDKLFSMVWNGKVILSNDDNQSIEANIIKLGGDSIVFELNEKEASFVLNNASNRLYITLKESVSDITVDLNIAIRVLKFYRTNVGYVIVAKYLELHAGDKDRLLRLLFRKQIEIRKSKNKLLHDTNEIK